PRSPVELIAAVAEEGFRFGVVVAALGFGFRHGIDWDHIAAITDITSSQDERRRSVVFGTLYALGHALVVLVLGILAILVGERLPESVDNVMTRIVGVTLVVLGVYVFASRTRRGRDFRRRSRWMLIFAGVRRGYRWATRKRRAALEPAGAGDRVATLAPEDAADDVTAAEWHTGHHGRPRPHPHEAP